MNIYWAKTEPHWRMLKLAYKLKIPRRMLRVNELGQWFLHNTKLGDNVGETLDRLREWEKQRNDIK